MMESAGFRQIWELDVRLKSLLMRRQKAQSDFVNVIGFQPFD
jgi:hypothetical protein